MQEAAQALAWLVRLHLPESPRWYEIRGRKDEAEEVMAGIEQRIMRELKLSALPQPVESIHITSQPVVYREVFAPDLRARTVMMLVFQFFQTGIFYGFTSLAPTFLLHKGVTLVHTLLFSMIIYAGFFFGSSFRSVMPHRLDTIRYKQSPLATL